jgi:DNA-binding MarR family transcriptional regulator
MGVNMLRMISNIKKTHWVAWAECNRRVRRLRIAGMTPARFDVIQLLHRNGPMLQSAIRKTLGVVKSSVSELLRELESFGFITRSRARHRVGRRVTLTEKGETTYTTLWDCQCELEINLCGIILKFAWPLEKICLRFCERLERALAVDVFGHEIFYDSE